MRASNRAVLLHQLVHLVAPLHTQNEQKKKKKNIQDTSHNTAIERVGAEQVRQRIAHLATPAASRAAQQCSRVARVLHTAAHARKVLCVSLQAAHVLLRCGVRHAAALLGRRQQPPIELSELHRTPQPHPGTR